MSGVGGGGMEEGMMWKKRYVGMEMSGVEVKLKEVCGSGKSGNG